MPEALVGRHDDAGFVVVVEGAQPEQVLAVGLECDARGFDEADEKDGSFEPVDFVRREAGHFSGSGLNPVKGVAHNRCCRCSMPSSSAASSRRRWDNSRVNATYEFDWDAAKAEANTRKHGVTFENAMTVFRDPLALTVYDEAHSEQEERWVMIGRTESGVLSSWSIPSSRLRPAVHSSGLSRRGRRRTANGNSMKRHGQAA